MGESYGAWRMGDDDRLMDFVSSVNIACGFHAGDPSTIRRTVETAVGKHLKLGAHPSYPDRQGFGRREMALSAAEIFDFVLYQVAALKGLCEALGGRLHHVKPHGALYNDAAKQSEKAAAIAEAVKKIDSELIVYGLSGSRLITEAEKIGLRTASEVFADRTYQPDASLTPRRLENALIEDDRKAVSQVMEMVFEQRVTALSGEIVPLRAETICIHGDGPHAVEFARLISSSLTARGVAIQ